MKKDVRVKKWKGAKDERQAARGREHETKLVFIFIGINTKSHAFVELQRFFETNFVVFSPRLYRHTPILSLPRKKVVMQMKSVPFFLLRAGFERIKPMLSLQTLCKLSSRIKISLSCYISIYLLSSFCEISSLPYPDIISIFHQLIRYRDKRYKDVLILTKID